jgi:ribosomal protein S18 acetylase RimI-like enzyme
MHPLDHLALLAFDEVQALAGVLTYMVDGPSCEILTLHAAAQWHGVGTALVAEVERVAAGAGCDRLWVVTTNDNVDALRFYQRRGFRLAALRPRRRRRQPRHPQARDPTERRLPHSVTRRTRTRQAGTSMTVTPSVV